MYYLYRVMCGMIINQGKDTSEWYERHKSNTVMLPSTTVKYTVRGHNIYIKKNVMNDQNQIFLSQECSCVNI